MDWRVLVWRWLGSLDLAEKDWPEQFSEARFVDPNPHLPDGDSGVLALEPGVSERLQRILSPLRRCNTRFALFACQLAPSSIAELRASGARPPCGC